MNGDLIFFSVLSYTLFRYEMVWSETLATYREMISAEGWETKDIIDVPIIQKITFKARVYHDISQILQCV